MSLQLSMSRHDRAVLAATVLVALFGFLALTAKGRIALIRARRADAERLEKRLALQEALIDARDDWTARYEAVRDRMPVFSATEQVGPHWGKIMDDAAHAHDLHIQQRSFKEETVVAGVCELPIEVRQWEGTLEALVGFVHQVESTGAMLEVRDLRASPIQNRQGWLKGSFTLSCAYLRTGSETSNPATPSQP